MNTPKKHPTLPLRARAHRIRTHSMQLLVGHRPINLPARPITPADVLRAVEKMNRPFVVAVKTPAEQRFSVRRRVFILAEDIRVECETDGELGLACKLISDDHNRWQDTDTRNQECIEETERMEQAAIARMASDDSGSSGDDAQSDEDISIQEWGQMGYKWFRREDVTYV